MLAGRGATVVGVEPAEAMFEYAVARETELRQGVRYLQADLAALPDLGGRFDAVVSNVVLEAIPQWTSALGSCVDALRPGGLLLVTLEHPCFEDGAASWRAHGCVRVTEYLAEYERPGLHGIDFHRPLSTYLNAIIGLGCRLTEIVEPCLDPSLAVPGSEAATHVPNFVVIAARRD